MKMWRTIAILALSVSALLSAIVIYGLWAFSRNLDAVEAAGVQCLQPNNKFDSVAAAEMVGRLDLISGLLAMGGIAFVILGFFGFRIVRREVLDEAGRVAADEVRNLAQRYYGIDKNEGGTYIPPAGYGPQPPYSGRVPEPEGPKKGGLSAPLDPATVSTVGAVEEKPSDDAGGTKGRTGGDQKSPKSRRARPSRPPGK